MIYHAFVDVQIHMNEDIWFKDPDYENSSPFWDCLGQPMYTTLEAVSETYDK